MLEILFINVMYDLMRIGLHKLYSYEFDSKNINDYVWYIYHLVKHYSPYGDVMYKCIYTVIYTCI